jgi:DNA-binding transcriptional regulator of glucitol operon
VGQTIVLCGLPTAAWILATARVWLQLRRFVGQIFNLEASG